MHRPAELRRVQEAFLNDLAGPRAGEALERSALFETPPRGTVDERWAIYTSGYLARIAEALESDYPALRRILGPGPFRSLAARYLRACPPRSFDLGRAGDRLARFLEGDPLREDLRFLPDLARLEWALAEALVAPDAKPLCWSDLQALGSAEVAELPLVLAPGTTLLRSAWPLHEIWACRDKPDQDVSVEVVGRPSIVLVHRQGLDVRCRPLTEGEARFLEGTGSAGSLAGLQDEERAEGEAEVGEMLKLFRLFVEEGLFENTGAPALPACP